MQRVPITHKHLLEDETKAYTFLATTMPDGSPQVTPVWFNTGGEFLLINSNQGRVKDRNMRARPKVAALIMKLDDPYHYIQIRGEVIEITTAGGDKHINQLSHKYRGEDYDIPADHTRTIYKIKPTSFST